MARLQTLSEFLRAPFGNTSDQSKLTKYSNMYATNLSKIKLVGYTIIEDAYYFHVMIPSESHKAQDMNYDVVIRFFTNNPKIQKETTLNNYYIQFYSNSPGFIYNYVVLYKMHGFLITALYEKLDPRFMDTLPTKMNKNLELSYDKSIYFACRFLSEHKFRVLDKRGNYFGRKISPLKFFKEIGDFQTVKLESELIAIEKKAMKDMEKTLSIQLSMEKDDKKRELDTHRKNPRMTTEKEPKEKRIIRKGKITASITTNKKLKPSITRKNAGRTTVKPKKV